MAEHQWSNYQLGVLDFVKNGTGNGMGVACAGSGKTTIAVESMKKIPMMSDVFFGTFTNTIANELSKRLGGRPNTEFGTYNSFGWRLCLDQMLAKPKLDEDKTINILKYAIFNNLSSEEDRRRFYKSKGMIKRIVSLLKGHNCQTTDVAAEMYPYVVENYGLNVPGDSWFFEATMDVYEKSINTSAIFDFDDQKLMPFKLGLAIPQFDFLAIDEYQDTNQLESDLMFAACQTGRIMVIGDPDQSIYGFRGARPDSMDDFMRDHSAKKLPLYICYRCPASVIREAQKIVPHIEAAPGCKEGCVDHIKMEQSVKMVTEDDMILCRTTAGCTKYCLARIREGRKAYVKGKDIGISIAYVMDQIADSDYQSIPHFVEKMKIWSSERIGQMVAVGKERQASFLQDKINTIDALVVGCAMVTNLREKIAATFKDDGTGIQCMTIHKSKGLESTKTGNVHILRPDLLPHPKGEPGEEKRIKYVGITRTQNGLFFVAKEPNEDNDGA